MPGPTWIRLLETFPAVQNRPATLLRAFAVCQVIERPGWKDRKVVLVEKSEVRGCFRDGAFIRVSMTTTPSQLGNQVLALLETSASNRRVADDPGG
jgi:hypothetical protein